jgi:hypothetical protein
MGDDINDQSGCIDSQEPVLWEYKLTLETLRAEMAPTLQRWDALQRRLYSKPTIRVSRADSLEWMQDRMSESERMAGSFTALANVEFARAWGEPGQPGDADAIVQTSKLWAELCAGALAWEETVRFTAVDPIFEPVRELFVGVVGAFIDEAKKLPDFLESTIADPHASGTHALNMVLTVPDGWVEEVSLALEDASASYIANPG